MTKVTGKAFDGALLLKLLKLAKPYKKYVFIIISCIVLLSIFTPLRPWLVEQLVDKAIVGKNKSALLPLASLATLVLVLECLVRYANTYYATWLGQNVIKDLRVNVFKHLSKQSASFFDKTPIGTLTTRTISDIEAIDQVYSDGFLTIVGDLLQLLAVIGIMIYTNWAMTLVSLATIPILLIASYFFKEAVKKSFQAVRKEVAHLNAFSQEHLSGMAVIQLFGLENTIFNKFNAINSKHRDANLKGVMAYSVFFPIVEIVNAASLGLIVWYGSANALEGRASVGEMISFTMYIGLIFRPIRMLADRFNSLQMGMVAGERVFQVLADNDQIAEGTFHNSTFKGEITFDNVYFNYVKDQPVLNGISFNVAAGTTVAIVGATGSGKSTIIGLLTRFYAHQHGQILLDHTAIEQYATANLREHMAVIQQDVFLFSGSILDNIRLYNTAITEQEVLALAEKVGILPFIERFPSGLQFEVKERGVSLSTGQRQLIAFLRALIHNPALLILDEATSSIDSETEILLQKATQWATKGRTAIIIAHRLSTVLQADNILVLDHGNIIEQGNHKSLMALKGSYYKLYTLQFGAETPIVN